MASSISRYNRLEQFTESLLATGRVGFSLTEVKTELSDLSDAAIKLALHRLSLKHKIVSLFKGYYLILPPHYANKGILPAHLFVDSLMRHLNRPYYVGLLNAAVFHGATHQQPQEYFVVTRFPVLRPTVKNGLKINYISSKNIPTDLLEQRKTESGYLWISNAVLTACDLISFEKRVGGLNRVALVLSELAEVMKPLDVSSELVNVVPVATLQRLGFLLSKACLEEELAEALYNKLREENKPLFRIPLKTTHETRGFSSDTKWNVIVNIKIELDT
jgi:predicted transcriptional regulator of viral defense system